MSISTLATLVLIMAVLKAVFAKIANRVNTKSNLKSDLRAVLSFKLSRSKKRKNKKIIREAKNNLQNVISIDEKPLSDKSLTKYHSKEYESDANTRRNSHQYFLYVFFIISFELKISFQNLYLCILFLSNLHKLL
jgi:NADH:ubiquinone oxidoreductase subunit 3 (subunit A)